MRNISRIIRTTDEGGNYVDKVISYFAGLEEGNVIRRSNRYEFATSETTITITDFDTTGTFNMTYSPECTLGKRAYQFVSENPHYFEDESGKEISQ